MPQSTISAWHLGVHVGLGNMGEVGATGKMVGEVGKIGKIGETATRMENGIPVAGKNLTAQQGSNGIPVAGKNMTAQQGSSGNTVETRGTRVIRTAVIPMHLNRLSIGT